MSNPKPSKEKLKLDLRAIDSSSLATLIMGEVPLPAAIIHGGNIQFKEQNNKTNAIIQYSASQSMDPLCLHSNGLIVISKDTHFFDKSSQMFLNWPIYTQQLKSIVYIASTQRNQNTYVNQKLNLYLSSYNQSTHIKYFMFKLNDKDTPNITLDSNALIKRSIAMLQSSNINKKLSPYASDSPDTPSTPNAPDTDDNKYNENKYDLIKVREECANLRGSMEQLHQLYTCLSRVFVGHRRISYASPDDHCDEIMGKNQLVNKYTNYKVHDDIYGPVTFLIGNNQIPIEIIMNNIKLFAGLMTAAEFSALIYHLESTGEVEYRSSIN